MQLLYLKKNNTYFFILRIILHIYRIFIYLDKEKLVFLDLASDKRKF